MTKTDKYHILYEELIRTKKELKELKEKMGMFDSVIVRCPFCKSAELEFQSKAGDCILLRIDINHVPAEIAIDLEGNQDECPVCKKVFEIRIKDKIPRTIPMELKEL